MAHPTRIVVADDLTGANDTGVHFASPGHSVDVFVVPQMTPPASDAETVVVNTNTRFASPKEAYSVVFDQVNVFSQLGEAEIYKKVDSTLRGNVGAEIDAALDAGGFHVACVAPATPRNGRTVINGICYVYGSPLHETEIAGDPFTPVGDARVQNIIESQSDRRTALVSLSAIRDGRSAIREEIASSIDVGAEIFLCDAETENDLRAVRDAFAELSARVLYVGSAGLFHAFHGESGASRDGSEIIDSLHPTDTSTKTLVVVGSLMKTTLAQVSELLDSPSVAHRVLNTSLPVEDLEAYTRELVQAVTEDLDSFETVVLQTQFVSERDATRARSVGRTVGAVVRDVVRARELRSIVATGGDTAANVLHALGIDTFNLVGELLPGIPVGTITIPGLHRPTTFITKAGSYGEPNALRLVNEMCSTRHHKGATP